jgi:phosphohistidine phosphatase
MSRVLLLRHSRAAKAEPGMRDFDRPLEERGARHAMVVGEAMAAAGLLPHTVLCSAARRTRETWDGVRSALGAAPDEVRFLDDLYHSDVAGYLAAIRSADPSESVLVIGHNPMTAEAASMLVGSGERGKVASMRSRFPTSALAVIAFSTPLAQIGPGAGTLETWLMRDS